MHGGAHSKNYTFEKQSKPISIYDYFERCSICLTGGVGRPEKPLYFCWIPIESRYCVSVKTYASTTINVERSTA